MSSTDRSFGANATVSVFGWAVPALAALVAIPITVNGLGADQYGLLALTTVLTGYLGLMQMGLGGALVRYLAFYRALDEGRPMIGILFFGLKWFLIAGLIGGVFMWFAAPWLSSTVLKVPPELQQTSITVMRLTGVNFALALLVSVGTAIPQSFLRYDIASLMSGIIGTASVAGPAIIVTLGYELVPVVVFGLVLNAAALAAYAIVGLGLMRLVRRDAGPYWKEIRRKTLSFAGLTAVNSIGNTVTVQTSGLVVGIAGGVADAAYYQVPYTLASRINDMLSRVAQVLFPTASGLLARDARAAVQDLYIRASRLFFVLNFSVTMGLCVMAYPLLQFWVSDKYAKEGAVALIIFSLAGSLHATTMAASYINLSAARPGINVVFSNVANVINLATVYPLTVWLGVEGAALSGLIAALNVPFFVAYGNKHVLSLSTWVVWLKCYQPTIIGTLIVGVASYFLLRPLASGLVLTLFLWGITVLLAIVVSGFLGAIRREDVDTARRLMGSAYSRLRSSSRQSS